MIEALIILIVIVCVLLCAVVLIQNPKGGGIDASLGGAASNQIFGVSKSTDFVEKATWVLAAALLILCILSSFLLGGEATSGVPITLPQ